MTISPATTNQKPRSLRVRSLLVIRRRRRRSGPTPRTLLRIAPVANRPPRRSIRILRRRSRASPRESARADNGTSSVNAAEPPATPGPTVAWRQRSLRLPPPPAIRQRGKNERQKGTLLRKQILLKNRRLPAWCGLMSHPGFRISLIYMRRIPTSRSSEPDESHPPACP